MKDFVMIDQFIKSVVNVLIESRSSLSIEAAHKRLNNSQLGLNDIVDLVKQNAGIFRVEPNGDLSLRYDERFRHIVNVISNQAGQLEGRNEEDSLVMLFLLKVRCSDDLLDHLQLSHGLFHAKTLQEFIFAALNRLNSGDSHFKDSFKDILTKWDGAWNWEILDSLISEIVTIPDELFGRYFSDFTRVSGYKEWGTFNEPNPVTSLLIARLASLYQPATVLDPFGGIGHFAVESHKLVPDASLYLNDINASICRLGKINLLLNGVRDFAYCHCDSLSQNDEALKVDLVITNPPFGLNVPKEQAERFFDIKHKNSVESYTGKKNDSKFPILRQPDFSFTTHAILNGLERLREGGNMFLFVSESFLFHTRQKEIRKYLVEKNLLQSVISLPADLLKPYSRVKMSILHIEKKKSTYTENIKFILADEILDITKVDIKGINDVINEFRGLTSLAVTALPRELITKNKNSELILSRYIEDRKSNYGNFTLLQLVKSTIQGVTLKTKLEIKIDGTPVIRIKDLRAVKDSLRLEASLLRRYDLTGKKYSYIPVNSILFPRFGETIYPRIFSENQGVSFDDSSLLCFELNTNLVSAEYFVYQFEEPAVQDQIKTFLAGTTIPTISLAGLNRIRLNVPSLKEQKQFVQKRQEAGAKEVRLEQEGIEYERFATLKHSMSQPLSVLNTDLENLFSFLSRRSQDGEPIAMTDYVVNMLDESQRLEWEAFRLFSVKERILDNFKDLRNSFSKIDTMIKVNTSLSLEEVSLRDIWETVLRNNNGSNYRYRIDGNFSIFADKALLKTCFAYLVENAIKHGFQNRMNSDFNEIFVEIEPLIETSQVAIWYRNNGRPFADSFEIEHIFEKGRTSDKKSGSGFGGFIINQIIQKHRGDIIPSSFPKDPYPVQFKITLPIDHE